MIVTHASLSLGREITALFLGWQDYQSDLWLPVAKMTWAPDLSKYCLRYTRGMERAIAISEIEKSSFKHHPDRLYKSHITEGESLYFKSRMPLWRTTGVPECQKWLGLPPDPIDPIAYVSRTGGKRINDSYDVFPEVKPDDDGNYHFHFFPLDVSKMDDDRYASLLRLLPGDRLEIIDRVLVDKISKIGRLPGYLRDIAHSDPKAIQIEVAKINPKAPRFHGFLCHATVDSSLLTPFSASEYQTYPGADCGF
jgi:hypothetical protein